MKRKRPIYGNCKVLAPDGDLMFRCRDKRANWYLDRNLATIIENDPLTIQLTFEPGGKGPVEKHLKEKRLNICSVCGNTELEQLTRHHLIPYEYRRYFPDELKAHNSIYVIPICDKCHRRYEQYYAVAYKSKIAETYEAPINGKTHPLARIYRHAETHLFALLTYRDEMPPKRTRDVKNLLKQAMVNANMEISEEEMDSNEILENYLDFFKSNRITSWHRHGQIVVSKCKDLDAFGKAWVKHFVKSMKPKHMPSYLIDLCSAS